MLCCRARQACPPGASRRLQARHRRAIFAHRQACARPTACRCRSHTACRRPSHSLAARPGARPRPASHRFSRHHRRLRRRPAVRRLAVAAAAPPASGRRRIVRSVQPRRGARTSLTTAACTITIRSRGSRRGSGQRGSAETRPRPAATRCPWHQVRLWLRSGRACMLAMLPLEAELSSRLLACPVAQQSRECGSVVCVLAAGWLVGC